MTGEGFLLVFAINDKTTFQEVLQLRESVINLKDTSKVPFVIVGNKCVSIYIYMIMIVIL